MYETTWDVVGADYTPDDSHLLVYVNADARTELVMLNAQTLQPVALPRVPAGDITGVDFSEDGKRLGVLRRVQPIPVVVVDRRTRRRGPGNWCRR
ncbi:MAG: hypothetical protein IPO20_22930 [Gammaproteobacteria bacterium]|nr:hypothetical protein [Gammaproteobacteria bacterium]